MANTLKLWSLVLLIGAMFFAACNDDEPVTPSGATPEINLKAADVEAAADGGELSVAYTISNPVEGGKVSATTTENWLGKFSTDEPGTIKFTVAPNSSREAREATVEVAYSALKTTKSFVVRQAGSTDDAFKLTVSDAQPTSLTIHVKPLDMESEYLVRSYSKSYIEVLGLTSDEELFEHDMSALKNEAGMNGLHNYIQKVARIGEADVVLEDLQPDTDYFVYCYHVDVSTSYPTLVGTIYTLDARTAKPEVEQGISFEMDFDIDGYKVTQTINPGDYEGKYHYGVWSVSDFNSYYGATADMADTFVKRWYDIIKVQQTFGKDLYQICNEFCLSGVKTLKHEDLLAETEYVFYAFAVDAETGYATSECCLERITTKGVASVDATIEITTANIMPTTADVFWVASDANLTFARGVYPRADWDAAGSTDDERLATFVAMDSFYTAKGSTDMNLSNLTPDTEYIAFAYGVEGGVAITPLFSLSFKTLPKVMGESVLSMSFDGYYLLSELAVSDPTNFGYFADNTNTVLLPVHISVEPYSYDIYYEAMPMVHDYYTDDQWITVLQSKQQYDYNSHSFYLTVDKTYTLLGIAKDSNGNWGPLFKYEITPTLDGCSDASSYVYEADN